MPPERILSSQCPLADIQTISSWRAAATGPLSACPHASIHVFISCSSGVIAALRHSFRDLKALLCPYPTFTWKSIYPPQCSHSHLMCSPDVFWNCSQARRAPPDTMNCELVDGSRASPNVRFRPKADVVLRSLQHRPEGVREISSERLEQAHVI